MSLRKILSWKEVSRRQMCTCTPKSDTLLLAAPVAARLMECGRECGCVCLCLSVCVCVCVCVYVSLPDSAKSLSLSAPWLQNNFPYSFFKAIKKPKKWLMLLFCHLVVRNVTENVCLLTESHLNKVQPFFPCKAWHIKTIVKKKSNFWKLNTLLNI